MSDSGRERRRDVADAVPVFTTRDVRHVRDLLARFAGARRAVRFYPAGHPAIPEAVAGFMEVLRELHGRGLDVPLTFAEGEILLGERVLTEESVMFDQLARDMSGSAANSMTFCRGVTPQELERVLPVLGADDVALKALGGLQAALAAAEVPHVTVSTVRATEREPETRDVSDKEASREVYAGALELLRELEQALDANRVVSGDRVRTVVRNMVDNVVSNVYALLELTGLKDHDEYTFYHSVNVAILSLSLGAMLSTDRRFLNSLGVGALLHDIGKTSVEFGVLNKAGALTSDEWDSVRMHPLHGAEAAAVMPGLDRSGMVIILEHHMRYDMDGYPTRYPRRPQHLASRIVAVADAYDAMTSRRSYSVARLQDQAMEVLAKNAGTAFDPVLVRLFIQLMGMYPPRSVVRLDSGEVGVVIRPGETDVLRPMVRVFAAADGGLVEPRDVDLADAEQAAGRAIVACLDPAGLNVDIDEYL